MYLCIEFMEGFIGKGLLVALQMILCKTGILLLFNLTDIHYLGALIKWTIGGSEQLHHCVLLAPRKNKVRVDKMLYIRTEHGLHLAIGILRNHLKFIEGHIARDGRFFKIFEQLTKGGLLILRL